MSLPKPSFLSVHVIGTNGKGSVSTKISYALEKAGYKVGLFTSPHLDCITERIQINRKPIEKNHLEGLFKSAPSMESFFSQSFFIAFNYFQYHSVDFVVWEAGIGARLDPIRLVDPFLTVITSLGFDHTQILGPTLEKIAREKGALFTKDLVISRQALTSTIVTLALERKANVAVAETDEKDYQASNTYTALKAVEFFRKKGIIPFCMEFKEFYSILPKGRFEEVKEGIILDVAHNPQGLEALILKCREKYAEGGTLLLGGYRDKDLVLMVKKHHSYFEKILVWDGGKKNLRMYPKEELKEQLEKLTSRSIGLVQDLDLEHYLGEEKRGLLLITGGFAIVREARERLRGLLNP